MIALLREKIDARDVIMAAGLASFGIGIGFFSIPAALIAVGGILISIAAGYLK